MKMPQNYQRLGAGILNFSRGTHLIMKRKYQETVSQEVVHASRKSQVYGTPSKPTKKPRRFEPPVQRKQAHASSVNAIKKKIRDLTRKLERAEGLPADVRAEDERALAAYQQELASAEAEKIRQKMIKKYHMVRFFGK
jgi:rRNA-processing protein Efg1